MTTLRLTADAVHDIDFDSGDTVWVTAGPLSVRFTRSDEGYGIKVFQRDAENMPPLEYFLFEAPDQEPRR